MSSFTSNFRAERKVLLVPLAVLVVCEFVLRFSVTAWSADAAEMRRVIAVQTAIRSHMQPTVLFLGNSLTREGVRVDALTGAGGVSGGSAARTFKISLDDTTVIDWYYLFERYFYKSRTTPDVLILNYAGRQLDDSSAVQTNRLALSVGWTALTELFENDVRQLGGRADYALSVAWYSFAYRDRIRNRVLGEIVPAYRETAARVNAGLRNRAGDDRPTYKRLRRLLHLCHVSDTLLVIVAICTPRPEQLDPELVRVVHRDGGIVVDLRKVEGLAEGDYADGYHLNAHGAVIYSQALARRLRAEPIVDRRLHRGGRLHRLASIQSLWQSETH